MSSWGSTPTSHLSLLQATLWRVVPALGEMHHTTFARQAASLWKYKERLWQERLTLTPHDRAFANCDSMPLPACSFAHSYRCHRFRGEAAFGKDTLRRRAYGLTS